jgi:transcriptional regulator with XRE-family HTH domain
MYLIICKSLTLRCNNYLPDKEKSRVLGITQAELARRIGISASYLNLIERNKRRIAGPLLRRAAGALDLGLDELDGAAERRLLETLNEVAHLPDLQALGAEADSAGELIGRYPGWARALAALARSERAATSAARALADRLTHDPFLGETVHRMLTRIAAVRSAAEILVEFPDIPRDRRERFHSIRRVRPDTDAAGRSRGPVRCPREPLRRNRGRSGNVGHFAE